VSAYPTQRRRVGNMPSRRESTQHFLLAHVPSLVSAASASDTLTPCRWYAGAS